jgi:hypothetical protein
MKRMYLVTLALALAAVTAQAQAGITMGAMNGWMFSFSGNVNAFLTYTDPSCNNGTTFCNFTGSVIGSGPDEKVTRIQTGLAPSFAIFEAKGKEGGMDLGVHFGFAPEIQSPNRLHDTCGGGYSGSLQCGTQIDMREVFLTVGGGWGQILAGRAIGVYQKENLLTDMTVFGVGLTGGGAAGIGTSLGHIGTGYTYPNFNAQITYSSAANRSGVLEVGLFDPSIVLNTALPYYDITQTPRLEAGYTYTKNSGTADKLMLYASGLLANVKSSLPAGRSATPWGLAAGGEWTNASGLQLDLSGFYQSGVGNVVMFDDQTAVDLDGNLRTSFGYLAQVQYMAKNSKWKFGASYGNNHMDQTDFDKTTTNTGFAKDNMSIVAAVTYMYTKSLRGVFNYTYGSSKAYSNSEATSSGIAIGMMLFF